MEIAKLEATGRWTSGLDDKRETPCDGLHTNFFGLVLYFARGIVATLALVAIGIVLLIAGIIYKPRKKKTENVTSDVPRAQVLPPSSRSLLLDQIT